MVNSAETETYGLTARGWGELVVHGSIKLPGIFWDMVLPYRPLPVTMGGSRFRTYLTQGLPVGLSLLAGVVGDLITGQLGWGAVAAVGTWGTMAIAPVAGLALGSLGKLD